MGALTITDLSQPATWIGVRDKAVYRFRLRRYQNDTRQINFANVAVPGYVGLEFMAGAIFKGDYVEITACPIPEYIGTWRVAYTTFVLNTHVAALAIPVNTGGMEPATYDVFQGTGITPRIWASRTTGPGTDPLNRNVLATLSTVRAGISGYYQINVAEYLKARIAVLPDETMFATYTELSCVYNLEVSFDNDNTFTPIGADERFALNSMLPDLSAYHTGTASQLLVSPFGNIIPYWPGYPTLVSWIRVVDPSYGAGIQMVIPAWLNSTELNGSFPFLLAPDLETEIIVSPVAMGCPIYTPLLVFWLNPQGGWSSWLFGYDNENFDEIEEQESYRNSTLEIIRTGVVSRTRIALKSGFISRPEITEGLQSLRRATHVFVLNNPEIILAYDDANEPLNYSRVNIVPGSFFLKKASDKRFEVDLEIVYAKENYT